MPAEHDRTDGLIRLSPSAFDGRLGRFTARTLLAVFCVTLAGTGLVDTLFPAPAPKLAGAEAQEDQQLRHDARFADGTLAQLAEYDLRLRSRVRRTFAPPYALLLYKWFREVQGTALVGRERWLFLADRAVPPDRSTLELVSRGASALAALDRSLAQIGVRLVVVPVPRKAVVCKSWLPPGTDPRADIEPAFVDALRQRGVETVDLLPRLAEEAAWRLFDPNGSHWTLYCQTLAAKQIATQLDLIVALSQRTSVLRQMGRRRPEIDLLSAVGLDSPAALEYFTPRLERAWGVYDENGGRSDHVQPGAMPAIAITGTSFTAKRQVTRFLEHFTDQPIWNAAEEGVNPLGPVGALLRDRSDEELPRILLCEVPVHAIFAKRPFDVVGQLIADIEQRVGQADSLVIVPTERVRLPVQGSAQEIGNRKLVAEIKGGFVAHDGNGVAHVRLTGKVSGGTLRIDALADAPTTIATWPAGTTQITLPLVSEEPFGGLHYVLARGVDGEAQLTLERVDVVAPLDRNAVRNCLVQDVEPIPASADAGGAPSDPNGTTGEQLSAASWSQNVVAPAGLVVPAHATLLLKLAAPDALEGGLSIEVQSDDPSLPPLVMDIPHVRNQARILLGLDPFAGQRLASIQVRGEGDAPRAVVGRAQLFAPRRTP